MQTPEEFTLFQAQLRHLLRVIQATVFANMVYTRRLEPAPERRGIALRIPPEVMEYWNYPEPSQPSLESNMSDEEEEEEKENTNENGLDL